MRWYRSDRGATGQTRTEVAMKWFALLAAVLGWCAHAHDARARNDAPRPKTEECNRVVFAIFDLIDVEFSKSEPNYPDIKAALKGAPSQLSCEFSALADVAKRRKYFHKIVTTPVFLADGKERLPRI